MFFGCHSFRLFLGVVIILGDNYCMERKKVVVHPLKRGKSTPRPSFKNRVNPDLPVATGVKTAVRENTKRPVSPLYAPRDRVRESSPVNAQAVKRCHCIIL